MMPRAEAGRLEREERRRDGEVVLDPVMNLAQQGLLLGQEGEGGGPAAPLDEVG